MESEAKKQGSYVTGIIGAILGGTIATIPWVLVYVYGNVMLSLLAVLIAAGEFYGYKICRGKMEKKLPAIIMILAIIIVTVVTLLVIPALLLAKEGLPVTTQAIKNLYSFGEFSTAIIKDYAISVIFTILGASVVTSSIKKQLADNVSNVTLDFSNNEEQKRLKEEAIKVLKPVFQRYDALHEDSTMTKEEIFAEVEQNSKIYFNCLKNYGIIKKYKGRYYYDESAEKNEKTKSSAGKISFIIATVLIVILVITVVLGGTNSTTLIQNEDVSYEVENGWNILQEYNESSSGWSYYKYINSKPNYNQEATNEIDYSSEPAVIRISYDKKSEDNCGDLIDADISYDGKCLKINDTEVVRQSGTDKLFIHNALAKYCKDKGKSNGTFNCKDMNDLTMYDIYINGVYLYFKEEVKQNVG